MHRRIAALTIAASAVLGLAACSGDTSAEPDAASSSAAEAPVSNQSTADACAIVQTKIQDASTALSGIDYTSAGADSQATIDAFSETVDGIGEAAESVSNADVKAATEAVHEDFTAARDLMTKVLIDGDTSAAAELTTVTTDMQTSGQALNTLCTS